MLSICHKVILFERQKSYVTAACFSMHVFILFMRVSSRSLKKENSSETFYLLASHFLFRSHINCHFLLVIILVSFWLLFVLCIWSSKQKSEVGIFIRDFLS